LVLVSNRYSLHHSSKCNQANNHLETVQVRQHNIPDQTTVLSKTLV